MKQPKQELENERLELEIQDLKRHWITKPSYLTALVTGLLAFIGLIWSLSSGVLDVKKDRLENEKTLLEMEVLDFQDQKESLIQDVDNLVDSLKRTRDSLRSRESELIASYRQTQKIRQDKFRVERDFQGMQVYYENYIDSLIQLISESQAIEKVLTTEEGKILTTKSGLILTTKDGKPISFPDAGVVLFPEGSD